jgi:hypothetical protein
MFFAETLGPAITPRSAAALLAFVKSKLGSRKSVPAADLQKIVAEFVVLDGSRVTVDQAIKYLANRGQIAADGRAFRITM